MSALNDAADKARKSLERSAAKISQKHVTANGSSISHIAAQKMLSLVEQHGEKGVQSVEMLPNWSEGATPRELPSGFRLIFDVNSSPVVSSAYDTSKMSGGTMAVHLTGSALRDSPMSEAGLSVMPSDLVKSLGAGVTIDTAGGFDDAYVGIFEHKERSDEDFMHHYYAIARFVEPELNRNFAQELSNASESKTSMRAFLDESGATRTQMFEAQRKARAEKVSQALRAVGVNLSVAKILDASNDAVCYSLHHFSDSKDRAALYSNAVHLSHDKLARGVAVSGSMRLGPVIMRGDKNSIVNGDAHSYIPATTGNSVPIWRAAREAQHTLKFRKNKNGLVNTAHTWDSSVKLHPLLASNSFRPHSNVWKMAKAANFSPQQSIEVTPVAVKIASSSGYTGSENY